MVASGPCRSAMLLDSGSGDCPAAAASSATPLTTVEKIPEDAEIPAPGRRRRGAVGPVGSPKPTTSGSAAQTVGAPKQAAARPSTRRAGRTPPIAQFLVQRSPACERGTSQPVSSEESSSRIDTTRCSALLCLAVGAVQCWSESLRSQSAAHSGPDPHGGPDLHASQDRIQRRPSAGGVGGLRISAVAAALRPGAASEALSRSPQCQRGERALSIAQWTVRSGPGGFCSGPSSPPFSQGAGEPRKCLVPPPDVGWKVRWWPHSWRCHFLALQETKLSRRAQESRSRCSPIPAFTQESSEAREPAEGRRPRRRKSRIISSRGVE